MARKRIPVRGHGQITIPKRLRAQLGIEEGDVFEVEVTEQGLLLKPRKLIDPQQAWFWSEAWQTREQEAEDAIQAGQVKRFADPEELIQELRGGDAPNEP